jgi:hypothetical protein
VRAQLREGVFFGGPGCKSIVLVLNGGLPALSSVTDTSVPGPSRHIALPHGVGRYRGRADIALVASGRRVYAYTA